MWAEVGCFMPRWKFWEPVFNSYSLAMAVATTETHNDTQSLSASLPEWSRSKDSQRPVLDMQCQQEIHFCLGKSLRFYRYYLLPQHNLDQRLAYFGGVKGQIANIPPFIFLNKCLKKFLVPDCTKISCKPNLFLVFQCPYLAHTGVKGIYFSLHHFFQP